MTASCCCHTTVPCTCSCCRVGQELMAAAGVSGTPHSLVVDRAGSVKFSGHPADPAFMSAVREVLHCALQASATLYVMSAFMPDQTSSNA